MQISSSPKNDLSPVRNAALNLSGDVMFVHDPCMAKAGDFYYLFSTGNGIPVRTSRDLKHWSDAGEVFAGDIPAWIKTIFPGKKYLWAPDISYFDCEYHLYYAVSTFGSNRSAIGLATNITLDKRNPKYHWMDRGIVIESTLKDNWNAIDPNLCFDHHGDPWLSFGSFWSGLKIIRVDRATGKPIDDRECLTSIAHRPDPPDAVESPFIIRRGKFYYLFASYDYCCRGAASTYNVRVGRSTAIQGPYLDEDGVSMLNGGGSEILLGTHRWKGPGGESLFMGSNDRWWVVYHAYDAENNGVPTLRINQVKWSHNGWPLPLSPISI